MIDVVSRHLWRARNTAVKKLLPMLKLSVRRHSACYWTKSVDALFSFVLNPPVKFRSYHEGTGAMRDYFRSPWILGRLHVDKRSDDTYRDLKARGSGGNETSSVTTEFLILYLHSNIKGWWTNKERGARKPELYASFQNLVKVIEYLYAQLPVNGTERPTEAQKRWDSLIAQLLLSTDTGMAQATDCAHASLGMLNRSFGYLGCIKTWKFAVLKLAARTTTKEIRSWNGCYRTRTLS
jgi:hypothetical protein